MLHSFKKKLHDSLISMKCEEIKPYEFKVLGLVAGDDKKGDQ